MEEGEKGRGGGGAWGGEGEGEVDCRYQSLKSWQDLEAQVEEGMRLESFRHKGQQACSLPTVPPPLTPSSPPLRGDISPHPLCFSYLS